MYHAQSFAVETLGTFAGPRPFGACGEVMALVSNVKHVPVHMLKHASRCRLQTARARQLAMYLSHVMLGRTLTEVGEAFGRDRTTVSYACALIEDMRDDPDFDAEVSALEAQIDAAGIANHD